MIEILESKVISRHRGYEVRECTLMQGEGEDLLVTNLAYGAKDGALIGKPAFAALLDYHGALPEKLDAEEDICSVAYSPKKGLWYGWHRGDILGFDDRESAVNYVLMKREE